MYESVYPDPGELQLAKHLNDRVPMKDIVAK